MFLLGSVVNTIAILVGSLIGTRMARMPERIKTTVMQGLGIFLAALGVSMSLAAPKDALYIVLSLVLGGALGAWLNIEDGLNNWSRKLESLLGKTNNDLAEGFIFSTLVFAVGSMAIVGAIQSGVTNDNSILFTKSVLDGFAAIIFASTMGLGVGLSALPILLYEGGMATIAHFFGGNSNPLIISDLTATGGILIIGIGINVLHIKRIEVANLLPSLLVVACLRWLAIHLSLLFVH